MGGGGDIPRGFAILGFHELMHNVEHHVAEEEAAMFPLAQEALADDLDALMEEMQMLKADLQGS